MQKLFKRNPTLHSFITVLLFLLTALGVLFPFLPLHMTAKGLSIDQAKIVSIVAPCIALIGPLVAGPLADKLAGGLGKNPRHKSGKYLRIMLATCFIFSILLYWLLMIVPPIVSLNKLKTKFEKLKLLVFYRSGSRVLHL